MPSPPSVGNSVSSLRRVGRRRLGWRAVPGWPPTGHTLGVPFRRRLGRPFTIGLVVAVAAAVLVAAGWATRRDDGRAAPAQGHPITPPVHSEGQVETVPLDKGAAPEAALP